MPSNHAQSQEDSWINLRPYDPNREVANWVRSESSVLSVSVKLEYMSHQQRVFEMIIFCVSRHFRYTAFKHAWWGCIN